MSFHVNAEDLRVDDGSILAGKLPNEAGDLIDAWIDLNTIIGNEDGTSRPASVSATSSTYQTTDTHISV